MEVTHCEPERKQQLEVQLEQLNREQEPKILCGLRNQEQDLPDQELP